jgi:uncharacterized protein (DUF1330 family)
MFGRPLSESGKRGVRAVLEVPWSRDGGTSGPAEPVGESAGLGQTAAAAAHREGCAVAGYFLVDIIWDDEEGRQQYVERISDTLTPFGGEFLTRGPEYTTVEGDWVLDGRLVVLRFPSAERAMAWYGSDEYAPLLAVRKGSARTKIIFFEGA